MKQVKIFFQNKRVVWPIIIILTLLQLIRLVYFVSIYGGIEHDGGWALGTARTLAETGKYATMVSTIIDPTPGGHISIHDNGRYKVQDELGRIFFAPDSIGPGSIIPNALIIKIFGADFWQYRTGSLLFFTIALLLSAYLLYQVGGLLAFILTNLFIFFYPHLIIYLGYEALGEIYGLAYMLLAFVLFSQGLQAEKRRWSWFLGCGLAAGLMLSSKLVGLLALSGLAVVCGLSFWEKRISVKEVLIIVGAWALPLLLWELYQFFTLTMWFDLQTYQGFKDQLWQYFVKGGSGVNASSSRDPDFIWEKLLAVREITSPAPGINVAVFLLVFLSGPFLLWRYYKNVTRRNIVIFFSVGWFTTSLWFILLSQNGWIRHYWYALIFSIFLLSLFIGYFWQHFNESPKWFNRVAALVSTGVTLVGFISQMNSPDFFTAEKVVEEMYRQRLVANHTRIPWVIIPRDQQNAAVSVLNQLPPSANLYYPGGFKSAEMALLSGRMIYPLERRPFVGPTENDVVLIGPDLISPWAKPLEKSMTQEERTTIVNSIKERINSQCPRFIFENDYYMICSLD